MCPASLAVSITLNCSRTPDDQTCCNCASTSVRTPLTLQRRVLPLAQDPLIGVACAK